MDLISRPEPHKSSDRLVQRAVPLKRERELQDIERTSLLRRRVGGCRGREGVEYRESESLEKRRYLEKERVSRHQVGVSLAVERSG